MSAGPDEVWTIQRILSWTKDFFAQRGIDNPRLDAELLLAAALGCERIRLYTDFDKPLGESERTTFRAYVKRRASYEPVAYILGQREFFSRSFEVSPAVLIPRPETEHLVEAVLEWWEEREEPPRILDIGTGSGNLAITLACELQAQVVATDVSADALAVAAKNARTHGVADQIEFRQGDLFAPVGQETFDIIVSNPPYVETTERAALMPDVREWEPDGALFAGKDGLGVLAPLCTQVHGHLREPGLFVVEFGHTQAEAVGAYLSGHGPWAEVKTLKDLQGHQRAIVALRA